jgi:murein DD-endopeptidase MepM/ murein hydrolase activator NlpD
MRQRKNGGVGQDDRFQPSSNIEKNAKAALFLTLLLGLSACATAQPMRSERRGFFDRMGEDRRVASQKHGADPLHSTSELRSMAMRWPLSKVEVTSPFGERGDGFHEGVDLRAKSGTPVFAALSGKVIYAGKKIKGYGKLVVIRHSNGIATVYAHNSKILVHKGQRVLKGAKIAVSGATGHVSGPHLHFEVRDGVSAVDPVAFLPEPARMLGSR